MKIIGILFVISGLLVLSFILLDMIQRPRNLISPLLEDEGVRIIYMTPTK